MNIFYKAKAVIEMDVCMKLYNKTRPLYLQIDTSGVGLGAGLLQMRDGTNCPQDIAPGNIILRLLTFANKSLSDAERRYSSLERKNHGDIIWIIDVLSLLLCQGGK